MSEQYTPLVSILIPAYKPEFFAEALSSGLDQTYENVEIVIGDDSEKGEIEKIVSGFAGHRNFHKIKLYENKPRLGPHMNYIGLFELAEGEFIKFLNDDDLLAHECIEIMVSYFERYRDQLALVTSKRNLIDHLGRPLPDMPATDSIDKWMDVPLLNGKYYYLKGRNLGNAVITNMVNMIGEPTTALFRKSDLAGLNPNIFSINGNYLLGNIDVTMWLNLLSKGDAVYISDPLSSFRIHPTQEQQNEKVLYHCYLHWYSLIEQAPKLGFLKSDADYEKAVSIIRKNLTGCLNQVGFSQEHKSKLERMARDLARNCRRPGRWYERIWRSRPI